MVKPLFSEVEIVQYGNTIRIDDFENHDFSYSTLNSFDKMGRSYFTKEKPLPSIAMRFGQLVEDILFNGYDYVFDKYKMIDYSIPTAMTKTLADAYIIELLSEEEVKFKQDKKLVLELIEREKLWTRVKDESKILEKFDNDKFWNYIEVEISKVIDSDKIVVPGEVYQDALQVVQSFLEDDFVQNYFRDKRITLQTKFFFEHDGVNFISIPDVVFVDKYDNPYKILDLKIKHDKSVNSFMYSFLDFRYDIQNTLYKLVLYKLLDIPLSALDVKFLVGSKYADNPQFFATDIISLKDFETKNKKYKGIETLIDEFKYYQENGVKYPINYERRGFNFFSINDL